MHTHINYKDFRSLCQSCNDVQTDLLIILFSADSRDISEYQHQPVAELLSNHTLWESHEHDHYSNTIVYYLHMYVLYNSKHERYTCVYGEVDMCCIVYCETDLSWRPVVCSVSSGHWGDIGLVVTDTPLSHPHHPSQCIDYYRLLATHEAHYSTCIISLDHCYL